MDAGCGVGLCVCGGGDDAVCVFRRPNMAVYSGNCAVAFTDNLLLYFTCVSLRWWVACLPHGWQCPM